MMHFISRNILTGYILKGSDGVFLSPSLGETNSVLRIDESSVRNVVFLNKSQDDG
jgi:hypothetical protein